MSESNETPNDVLEKPAIKEFLESNQNLVNEVTTAAKILQGNPDIDTALTKLLPALSNKIINVFFSYKTKDETTATQIIQILRELSAEKLKIVHQGEFEAGTNWRDTIKRGIKSANWFILLLPDPSDDWDWCLFETGLFVAHATSADRLICLHHPNIERPSQISEFESIPATQTEVEKFLRMALIEDNPISGLSALNKAVEKNIHKYATDIVNVIRPPSNRLHREIFEPYIELRVENPEELTDEADLENATVISSNQQALDIFDYLEQPDTWGNLHETVTNNTDDHRWRKELFHVIRKISSKRKFYPVQAVFKSANGKIYKPVVNAVNRNGKGGGIESFCIIFAEEVGVFDDSETPKNLAIVGHILKFAFRFRLEVLEKFTKRPLTGDDIPLIDNAIRRIKVDTESRGISDPNALINAFPEENRGAIEYMLKKWNLVRNPDGTGTLDIAIENKDVEYVQEILKDFITLNQEFLEMASNRLISLLQQHPIAEKEEA